MILKRKKVVIPYHLLNSFMRLKQLRYTTKSTTEPRGASRLIVGSEPEAEKPSMREEVDASSSCDASEACVEAVF